MRSVTVWALCLCFLCVFPIGCKPKTQNSTTRSSEDGELPSTTVKDDKSKKRFVTVKRDVKEIIGNWVIVFTNQGNDNYRWIIQFSRGEGDKIVSELIDTSQDKEEHDKPKVTETDVNGDSIKVVFKNEHSTFDFIGTFQQGFIRGTTRASPAVVYLTRFLPTEEKSLEFCNSAGLPPGADVFEAKLKSKELNPTDLMNTVRELKTSPLAQDMYALLMTKIAEWRFDEETLKQLIDDDLSAARIWGERWEARVELMIAISLINTRKYCRLAPAHLDSAEQKLGDDKVPMQESLNNYRESANVSIRVQDLLDPSSTDDVRSAANAELTEFQKKQPFNGEILFALATEAERTEHIDAAIEYLSDVVALPLLEIIIMQLRAGEPQGRLPHEMLKELWIKKHGGEEGYEKHLAEVYTQKIDALIAETKNKGPVVPDAAAGNRTVLVEMFTGISCTQCVAADLGLIGIGRTYPQSEVIVMRYHLHIPGPDGMANPDSEERAIFYEVNATPTVFIDGMKVEPRYYSGPMQGSAGAYEVFRKVIDPEVEKKSDVAIKVSAAVSNGQLEISAEATGVPEEELPACRLRLAIVQNHVETFKPLTTNGIRYHEFLVRELLGGAKGIPPKNGELKYSSTMPVADLQEHVTRFVTQFEAGRRFEFPPELKPAISGPLSIVAWVQNGNPDKRFQGRLVLQSTIVPVSGETGFDVPTSTIDAVKPANETPSSTDEKPKAASQNEAQPKSGEPEKNDKTTPEESTKPSPTDSGSPK